KGSRILTTAPSKGAQLNEGDVAMNTSGRPVFVVQGERPAYRDLTAGVSGDDVRQLQGALNRLGFSHGAVNGTYDQGTASAVAAWYLKAGYAAQGMTDEQIAALRTYQGDLQAQQPPATPADLQAANDAVVAAGQALDQARGDLTASQAALAAVVVSPDAAKAAAQARSDATLADADAARAAQLVPLAQNRLGLATGRSAAIVP